MIQAQRTGLSGRARDPHKDKPTGHKTGDNSSQQIIGLLEQNETCVEIDALHAFRL